MRLHFYEAKTAIEVNQLWDRALSAFTEGAFRLVEWTLVIATLFYFGIQTESALFTSIGWMLFMLMALRTQAFFVRQLDIQFWPSPLSRGQWWFTSVAHVIVGLAFSAGSLIVASLMARTLANSSLL